MKHLLWVLAAFGPAALSLAALAEDTKLELAGKDLADEDLARLKGRTNLLELHLDAPRVTDAGIASLADLVNLRKLSLAHSALTDEGLAHLKRLTSLKVLDLSHTDVRGPGLTRLAGMTNLEFLSLEKTQVTTQGLKHLPAAERLRWVDVRMTRVQLAGLDECPGGKVKLEVDGLTARLIDAESGKPFGPPLRHSVDREGARINCWAFSADGKRLAIGAGYYQRSRSATESMGQLRVWDTSTGALLATYGYTRLGCIRGVAFHKDSQTVLFQADSFEVDGP